MIRCGVVIIMLACACSCACAGTHRRVDVGVREWSHGIVVACTGGGQECPAEWVMMDPGASRVAWAIMESERACRAALADCASPTAGRGWDPWVVVLVGGALMVLAVGAGVAIGALAL